MNELYFQHQKFLEYSLVFKGNTERTIKGFRSSFKQFQKQSLIEKIERFDRDSVETWIIKGKLESEWSPKTIKNKLQDLQLFADYLVQKKLKTENDIRQIPRPKLPKTIPKHLTRDESITVLEWTRNFPYKYRYDKYRAIAIMATFIFSGIRLTELRNLKVCDVDIQNRNITVRAGKGLKDRMIPMNLSLMEHLERYVVERKRLKKSNPYFFSAMRQDSQMGDLVIKRMFIKIREKCKIHIYPHLLRHTFATLMLEGGCDIFSLSKMMGHSDIKTTTIYLSATTTHLREQIIKHPVEF